MSKGALDRSISYYNVVISHFTVYLLEAGKLYSKLQRNRPGTIKNQTAKYIKTSLEINLAILIKKAKRMTEPINRLKPFRGKSTRA